MVIRSRTLKDRQHNSQMKKDKRQKEFEDTKGVIGICKWKDRQHNVQKKTTKGQTTIYKTYTQN